MKYHFLTIIAALLVAFTSADAQSLRLPASHAREHRDLIANQKPLRKSAAEQARRLQKMRQREDIEDFMNLNWESDFVNPYGSNVEIPAHKNIDVREFVMPVDNVRITSNYGYRAAFGRMHRGTDLGLNVGDTVRAAFSGKVRLTKFERAGYGYYVVVRHPNGLETVYGHLSRFLVKPNQEVKAGQAIALGGNTGRSTGPHLHFETRFMGLAINPATIVDFENGVTHKEFFAFDHSKYKQQQVAPRGYKAKSTRSSKRHKALASKSKSKKNKASKASKRKRRR